MAQRLDVNVHTRALRAADRINGHSGSLQETLPPEPTLWERVWGHFVVTRADGKYTISQPLALVLIGVLGTAFFAYYWRTSDTMQDQHDKIIRLETTLELEKVKNLDQDSKIDQARATAQIADKNSARLEGKFDQFALQYATSPKKALRPPE